MLGAWFLHLKTVRGDYFKQESLLQKPGTVSSLSLRQRTVAWVLNSLISHLCSGVVSALPNKNHPGRKQRPLKLWLPTLQNHLFSPRICERPAQPALPEAKAWHGVGGTFPRKPSLAVRVRPNLMPYVAFIIIPVVFESPGSCAFP